MSHATLNAKAVNLHANVKNKAQMAFLLAKPTPHNVTSTDSFSAFNKSETSRRDGWSPEGTKPLDI